MYMNIYYIHMVSQVFLAYRICEDTWFYFGSYWDNLGRIMGLTSSVIKLGWQCDIHEQRVPNIRTYPLVMSK